MFEGRIEASEGHRKDERRQEEACFPDSSTICIRPRFWVALPAEPDQGQEGVPGPASPHPG